MEERLRFLQVGAETSLGAIWPNVLDHVLNIRLQLCLAQDGEYRTLLPSPTTMAVSVPRAVGRGWMQRPWASVLSGFQGMWLLEKFEISKNREVQ